MSRYAIKLWRDNFCDIRVIGIYPHQLLAGQKTNVDEFSIKRRKRESFKAQHRLLGTRDHPLDHEHQVLDTDPVCITFVVTRFVGQNHAWLQRLLLTESGGRGGDALGPLVDAQVRADAMTGAMFVVTTHIPQELPCERVQLSAACAAREDCVSKCNVSLEDSSEAVAHFGCGLTDGDRSRDVGCTVEVLAAGVNQIQCSAFEPPIALWRGLVMRNGRVRAGGGDRLERKIAQLARGLAKLSQACGSGVVAVQVKLGRRTVSTRRAKLAGDCSFRTSVTFRHRRGRLKFTARFYGNRALLSAVAKTRFARAK